LQDLDRLQALDAELTEEVDDIDADITKVLRARDRQETAKATRASTGRVPAPSSEVENVKMEDNVSEVTPAGGPLEELSESLVGGLPDDGATPKAPVAQERYQKAKIRMLTQQVEESKSVRKKMMEQANDLQRQLKFEREETRKLRKRIQILETDSRRQNNLKSAARNEPDVGVMEQDIILLKKDLATAERIAKSADATNKSKDLQLKRASEQINKLKAQLVEAVAASSENSGSEQGQVEALKTRNRVLEKQRNDLVDAFKKQMKLIDVLKRQKVHIEAARLLNFTETEFMKTLDWAV